MLKSWKRSLSAYLPVAFILLIPLLLYVSRTSNVHFETVPRSYFRLQPKNEQVIKANQPVYIEDNIGFKGAGSVEQLWKSSSSINGSGKIALPWWDGGQCVRDSENGIWRPLFPSLEMEQPQKLKYLGGACGRRAAADGDHQRIVSLSLFGNNPGYWAGLSETLARVSVLYPGWKVYLYTDPRGRSEILCPLLKNHEHFRICDVTNLPYPLYNISRSHPTMWRVAPLGDPKIDVLLVRDSDMFLTEREQSAVTEWLASGKMFHVMRDHLNHKALILGGMWGARWDILPPKWVSSSVSSLIPPRAPSPDELLDIRNKMLRMATNRTNYGIDQHILKSVLWPEMVGFLMSHDSFRCKTFSSGWRPWPTQRTRGEFVGNAWYRYRRSRNANFTLVCPPECRPAEHLDWVFC